ncbi:thiamine phosphate synthase [Jannaschia sp. W003]|uniref:thiamine phosphate synthase n=1 Tax=Jannaschia sp. W003 TaxID=2867012 RepID=UPI0021A7CF43|nr:thiamine phosphate synthase [Jannaschia sp. W003]UWQ20587.1 thiamine phosphate synthase [Jannaschia sp. W003]
MDAPRIYLVTPPEIDAAFAGRLRAVLDAHDVACLRLALATQDRDRITRAADMVREVAHPFEVPLVIADHAALVEPLGLDGVHLTDPRSLRKLRADWGDDPIIGAFCGTSRHDGMVAGENGADYVAFGPVGASLGAGEPAGRDLFAWWSEMVEVPVVAEGNLDPAAVESLRDATDFLALGEEVWSAEDAAARLAEILAPLR